MLMCGNGAVCVMCCDVLWLAEQTQFDKSMRLEIRFDSKYAATAAVGTQRCSSNTELVHKLKHQWQCVNESAFGGVGMTHVGGHKGDPWNEMADSPAEAAMNGCVVQKWMLSFRCVPVAATWARAAPPRCQEWTSIFEKTEQLPVFVLEPKKTKSLRIATLNVLTLGPAEERNERFEDSCKASETREDLRDSWHRVHWPAGVSSACAAGGKGRFCHGHAEAEA